MGGLSGDWYAGGKSGGRDTVRGERGEAMGGEAVM